MSANRFLFQLAPSVHPIEGIGSGLLPTVVGMTTDASEKEILMGNPKFRLPTLLAMLPTVRTSSANGESAAEMAAGNPKRRLETEIAMLPTPNASVANYGESPETWLARREKLKEKGINGNGAGMPLSIAIQLLPTPRANKIGGYASPDFSPTLEQKVGMKLQPAFASWMMGFPEDWTESPFQSGEGKASKPTETQ